MPTETVNNRFEDDSPKIVQELTLKSFESFVSDYSTQLHNLQVNINTYNNTVWDIVLNPIILKIQPNENAPITDLIQTDNVIYNKILRVFASLCLEIQNLQSEAVDNYYSQLIYYGEGVENEETKKEGEIQLQIGRMMPTLLNLCKFVDRCSEVIKNCVLQLCIFYSNENSSFRSMDIAGANLTVLYEHIGSLLHQLATLDHIIEHHSFLREHWKQYKRMLKSVCLSSESFQVDMDQIHQFLEMLNSIENVVLQSAMLQTCVKQTYDEPAMNINVMKNKHFSEEWMVAMKELWGRVDQKLGEVSEMNERMKMVGVMCLFVLHQNVFQTQDKKMFKILWDGYKKMPCVVLAGSSMFYPTEFLSRMLPKLKNVVVDKKAMQNVEAIKITYLQKLIQTLALQLSTYEYNIGGWVIRLENTLSSSSLPPPSSSSSSLSSSSSSAATSTMAPSTSSPQISSQKYNDETIDKCKSLLQGLTYAFHLRHTCMTLLNLHASLHKPMTQLIVLSICRIVELVKVIETHLYRWSVQVVNTTSHLVQYFSLLLTVAVINAHKRLKGDKKVRVEVLSSLRLLMHCLAGPATRERILLMKLAMGFCMKNRVFKDDELLTMQCYLEDIQRFADFKSSVHEATDCSFIYWHQVILQTYFKGLMVDPVNSFRLQYLLLALNDVTPQLMLTQHSDNPQHVADVFQQYIHKIINENFLEVICREVETDLRLSIHLHLQLDSRNPFKVPTKQLVHFIRLPSLVIFDDIINVKTMVEQYLNKTFYNLTTVALHDWKTYSEMKVWAKHTYGLQLLEPHLPSQTLEQGLDVLEIMRNIHVFVSKYLYNLNNQFFVEKSSNNKHLSTINIQHTSNSIRTHGTGIMNTTVNFTYQFLTKKFFVFSQFLYDEHIKSRLIKDLRFFKENHAETNQKYPFERAEKFNRGIKKLGVTKEGLSYLDQFRMLISQIGNAMGYIRLIRSGGLHCCGNAIRFVPDLEDIINFEELCKEDGLQEQCIIAARHLDEVVGNMSKNFAEGTEYFKMLVEVFAPEFQNAKNIHMKNFFVILPPLTLNFVEHMISSKEKLNKKNKVGAAFTDDGFAMGVAYIMKLLNQYNDFDSLHWFQSVREKYIQEKQEIKKQPQTAKMDEKLQQTMMLTLKRLDIYQQEFDLLFYSLSSARIFFRGDKNVDNLTKNNLDVVKDESSNV